MVAAADEQSDLAADVSILASLARRVLVDRGVAEGELSLTLVDEETMAGLNRRHLGGEGPTDVLAFPLDAGTTGGSGPGRGEVPVLLGDVVVCPAVAGRSAAARSVPVEDELALLVVHGVLHVLGMDHAEPGEARLMRGAERDLLGRFHSRPGSPEDAAPERPRSSGTPPAGAAGSRR